MWKKVNRNVDIKYVYGEFPIYFSYTVGKAGKIFFENLIKEEAFTGGKCPSCGKIYLPPRIYCEQCMEEITEFIKLGCEGVVWSWTKVTRDSFGNPLKQPDYVGFVKITGSDGGVIHRIKCKNGEKPKIGMKVKAVLKPKTERKGTLEDILYFEET